MIKYIIGLFNNLFNPAVSFFAKIDNLSHISKKAKVYGFTQVSNSTIGDFSYVGRKSRIIHADVGKFCSIAGEVKVGMATHTLNKLSTSPIFSEKKNSTHYSWVNISNVNPYKRVIVGNDVWIGVRAMIIGGNSIGNGAVIAAGAIVTKDVPPYAIVAGVPAKVIRYRFSNDIIERLEKLQWWNLPEEFLKENISIFQKDDLDIDEVERIINSINNN